MRRKRKTKRRKGPEPKYPIDDWFRQLRELEDDEEIVLKQGVDFDCSTKSFTQQIWRFARNYKPPGKKKSKKFAVTIWFDEVEVHIAEKRKDK